MKHFVITISREYGSGGRLIGQALAERLGIDFYDKEIINMLMEESGFTRETVEEWQEKKHPVFSIISICPHRSGRFPTRFIWQRRRSLTSWR